jgi:Flp pilus assembly protein TadB
MMIYFLDFLLRAVGYSIGLTAILLLFISIGFSPKKIKNRIRINKNVKGSEFHKTWLKYQYLRWYHKLLQATVSKYKEKYLFDILSIHVVVFAFLLVMFGVMTHNNVRFTILFSLLFAFLVPICVLYIRLFKIRTQAQASIIPATIHLLQFYKKNNMNMIFALKETAHHLDGHIKLIFAKYLIQLQQHQGDRHLAAETFAFQVGGNWGRNLSIAILKSLEDGTDIEPILRDMTTDMSEFRKRLREAETEGREAARLGYLPIFLIPLTMILNAEFLMEKNAYYYHFGTSLGIRVFAISVLSALIGFAMAIILSKPRQGL